MADPETSAAGGNFATEPAEYRWDIFVSYRRDPTVQKWVQRVFVPAIRAWLPNVANLPAERIFLDVDHAAIPSGSDWPVELRSAIQSARCMVAILSPTYFDSPWCLAELHTMLKRQETTGHPCVYALRFSDGNFFSEAGKRLQPVDVEDFTWHAKPPQTKKFNDLIKSICTELANRVRTAPGRDPDWELVTPMPVPVAFDHKPGF